MPSDDIEKFKRQLASLGERQRLVLRLVCSGHQYKAIAEQMFVEVNTVKGHMRQVYKKLDLLQYKAGAARAKVLHDIYCPLLASLEVPLARPEADAPEPVPVEVEQMVDEDEKSLVLWRPQGIIEEPSKSIQVFVPAKPPKVIKPSHPLRWIVIGMALATVLIGAIAWAVVSGLNAQHEIQLTKIAELPPTSIVVTVIVTVSSPTPQVIVVTATALPASSTPQPTATSSIPTDTPAPTATPTPAVQLPFTDGFEQGIRPEWEILSGQPLTTNGRLTAAVDNVVLGIGDKSWSDYTVEFDYFSLFTHEIVLTFANKIRYHVAAYEFESLGAWEQFLNNKWVYVLDAPGVGEEGHLRLNVSGGTFELFVDGSPNMEVTFPDVPHGPFTIAVDTYALVDNLTISSP